MTMPEHKVCAVHGGLLSERTTAIIELGLFDGGCLVKNGGGWVMPEKVCKFMNHVASPIL